MDEAITKWLLSIQPIEQLWDAVLKVVHQDMWEANHAASSLLQQQMLHQENPSATWPTVYPGMDVIANRITPKHYDQGGAFTFYDHLVSFGQDHNAHFWVDDLDAEFAYQPGTSILFSGKGLHHSVPEWSAGERMVIAHYANKRVMDRIEVNMPFSLPSQLDWWFRYK